MAHLSTIQFQVILLTWQDSSILFLFKTKFSTFVACIKDALSFCTWLPYQGFSLIAHVVDLEKRLTSAFAP